MVSAKKNSETHLLAVGTVKNNMKATLYVTWTSVKRREYLLTLSPFIALTHPSTALVEGAALQSILKSMVSIHLQSDSRAAGCRASRYPSLVLCVSLRLQRLGKGTRNALLRRSNTRKDRRWICGSVDQFRCHNLPSLVRINPIVSTC